MASELSKRLSLAAMACNGMSWNAMECDGHVDVKLVGARRSAASSKRTAERVRDEKYESEWICTVFWVIRATPQTTGVLNS